HTDPWSFRFGNAPQDSGTTILVDDAGSAYISGSFGGAIDLGAGLWKSAHDADSFVAKLDSRGKLVWGQHIGAQSFATVAATALTPQAGLLCSGGFAGAADFGGGAVKSQGQQSAFLLLLDACGHYVWSRQFGGPDFSVASITSIGAQQDGSAVVAGWFRGSVDLGDGVLLSASTRYESFLAKYDAKGAKVWTRRLGEGARNVVVAVDAQDSAYVAGELTGAIDLGAGPLTPLPTPDHRGVFLTKLDPSGAVLWNLRDVGQGSSGLVSIRLLPPDAVLLHGNIGDGKVDLGAGVTADYSCCGADIFLAKVTDAGLPLWLTSFGTVGLQVAVGPQGVVAVSTVEARGFTARDLDDRGAFSSARDFAAWVLINVNGLAIDREGSLLLTGNFRDTLDLGQGPLKTAGFQDADGFVAKLPP
ncbi:MAG TPA: hypothetical protein VNG33_06060, partial [Polyangiaceae bacterium]|nr:hypothetical protein [Polyangiaceae bacterium]